MTVRNPFSRLVSAYYSKLHKDGIGHGGIFKILSKRMSEKYRHMRKNVTERQETYGGSATFEDFVNCLVKGSKEETSDAHWRTYANQCHPCVHRYDYIFKFESMAEDVLYLEEKLNFTAEDRKAFFPLRQYKSQPDLVKEEFAKVPRETALKLYELYREDFENFGYERPKWL